MEQSTESRVAQEGAMMKALSIRQPWAQLIIHGGHVGSPDGPVRCKRWETRCWRYLPKSIQGHWLAIHAGKHRGPKVHGDYERLGPDVFIRRADMTYGAIIGVVWVPEVRWLTEADEEDAMCAIDENRVGIRCESPIAFAPPIPYRGTLGLFPAPATVISTAEEMCPAGGLLRGGRDGAQD